MNKNILIFLITFSTLPAVAQEGEMENIREPRARERIRAAHAAYITERLELTPAEAEKFWPVYREYGEKRRALVRQMRDARDSGSDEKSLLELDLKIKQQQLDLEKDYSGRLQKIISAEKVLKLRQAEADFRKMVLRQIQHRQQQRHRRR